MRWWSFDIFNFFYLLTRPRGANRNNNNIRGRGMEPETWWRNSQHKRSRKFSTARLRNCCSMISIKGLTISSRLLPYLFTSFLFSPVFIYFGFLGFFSSIVGGDNKQIDHRADGANKTTNTHTVKAERTNASIKTTAKNANWQERNHTTTTTNNVWAEWGGISTFFLCITFLCFFFCIFYTFYDFCRGLFGIVRKTWTWVLSGSTFPSDLQFFCAARFKRSEKREPESGWRLNSWSGWWPTLHSPPRSTFSFPVCSPLVSADFNPCRPRPPTPRCPLSKYKHCLWFFI